MHGTTQAVADDKKAPRLPPAAPPIVFPCDCPDNMAKDKRRCGGLSAWCRQKGRKPDCTDRTKAGCKRRDTVQP